MRDEDEWFLAKKQLVNVLITRSPATETKTAPYAEQRYALRSSSCALRR